MADDVQQKQIDMSLASSGKISFSSFLKNSTSYDYEKEREIRLKEAQGNLEMVTLEAKAQAIATKLKYRSSNGSQFGIYKKKNRNDFQKSRWNR